MYGKGETDLFTDELEKIKQAEDKADAIKKEAKLEARQIVDKAGTEANRIIQEAELKAKEVYDEFLRDGERRADREQEEAIKRARDEANALGAQALKNQNAAIQFIKERIGKA